MTDDTFRARGVMGRYGAAYWQGGFPFSKVDVSPDRIVLARWLRKSR